MYRNPELLRLAKGKPCILCGTADGTVVACHYSGQMAGCLGKGMGQKATDIATAHLCRTCHESLDNYVTGNDDERAVLFLVGIVLTLDRLLQTGEIRLEIAS